MNDPVMMLADRPLAAPFAAGLQELRRHWGWFLVLGLALIVLGVLALGASVFTTMVTMIFLGWVLVVDGVLQGVLAFRAHQWSGFFQHLLAGILSVIVGGLILTKPIASALTLTLLLAAFFTVSGLFQVVAALVMQFPGRGWAILSGAVNVVLGILIWQEWPESSLWLIGTFVGIDLIFKGWSYTAFGLSLRTLPGAAHPGL